MERKFDVVAGHGARNETREAAAIHDSMPQRKPEGATEKAATPPEQRLIDSSALFDAQWYAERHPGVRESGLSPSLHYLEFGAAQGLAPSPAFDGADYLSRYPDLAAAGVNPLVHFLLHGQKEGRKATAADPEEIQARLVLSSGFFDEAWYLSAYPEVPATALPPVRHFMRHGFTGRYNPSPRFDAAAYIAAYPDVAASSVNPLLHYLQFGRTEGRAITAVRPAAEPQAVRSPGEQGGVNESDLLHSPAAAADVQGAGALPGPGPDIPQPQPESREADHARLILESNLFDPGWYTQRHPEVAASGLAPEIHYLRIGGPAGLPPSPGFDAGAYLQQYTDVRDTGSNPLIHYLLYGRIEQRHVRPFDPAEVLIRLVARSGYFDEEWYVRTYPEVLQSDLSPLQFFLKHGRELNHNPSPYFDSAYYVSSYKDLQASRINPLVHYLQFGYAEGRAIQLVGVTADAAEAPLEQHRPEVNAPHADAPLPVGSGQRHDMPYMPTAEDIQLLECSPLFDKAWYFNKYPDAARAGMSAAEHYLRFGASELRQPSIYFDPQYYLVEQSPEIQGTGINPLLHYILEGRRLGRKPRALFDFAPSPAMVKPLEPSAWPIVDAGSQLRTAPAHWTKQSEVEADHSLASLQLGGIAVVAGHHLEGLAAHEPKLSLLAELLGFDPVQELFGYQQGQWMGTVVPSADLSDFTCFGPELTDGRHRIADIWFSSGDTLRIRLGDDGQAPAPPLVLRVFQIAATDSAMPALIAEAALDAEGTSFVDAALVNPLLPVLFVLADLSGEAVETGVLPFPSLCRGGLHHAELAGSEGFTDPMAQIARLSARYTVSLLETRRRGGSFVLSGIIADIRGATGAEAVFQPQLRSWLDQVFGVSVMAADIASENRAGEAYLRQVLATPGSGARDFRRTGQLLLSLPADAIPTIKVMCEPGEGATRSVAVASYFVADIESRRPRLSVILPPLGADFLALQPLWAPHGMPVLMPASGEEHSSAPAQAGHVAIRFPQGYDSHRALTLMPLAPGDESPPILADASGQNAIDVFVRARDAEELRSFLTSVLRQRQICVAFVTVEGLLGQADETALASVLDELVPGHGAVVMRRRPAALGPGTRRASDAAKLTLIADAAIVMHDDRTAQTLATLLRDDKTASAGCVLIREAVSKKGSVLSFESGGYFPSHISFVDSPRLILSSPDCRGAFTNTTYPVIANAAGLIMVKTALLDEHGDSGEGSADGIAFALRATGAGLMHLCTSAVRAAAVRNEGAREVPDPPGIEAIGRGRWSEILGSIALVREIQ